MSKSTSGPIRQRLGLRKTAVENSISALKDLLDKDVPDDAKERESFFRTLRRAKTKLDTVVARLQLEHDNWNELIKSIVDTDDKDKEADLYQPYFAEHLQLIDEVDELGLNLSDLIEEACGQSALSLLAAELGVGDISHVPQVLNQGTGAAVTVPSSTITSQPLINLAAASSQSQAPLSTALSTNASTTGPPASSAMAPIMAQPPGPAVSLTHTGGQPLMFPGVPTSTYLPPVPTQHSFSVKPPRLELPKFSGDVMEWQQFWTIFETNVHTRPGLSNVEKFSLLMDRLEGTAKQAIKGLLVSAANYDVAVALLKDRFDHADERMIGKLYSDLRKLPESSSRTSDLRKTFDTTEMIFRQLEAAGEDVESNRSMTVELLRKFHHRLLRYVQTQHEIGPNSKLKDVRLALKKSISTFEMNDDVFEHVKGTTPNGKSTKDNRSKQSGTSENVGVKPPSTSALSAIKSAKGRDRTFSRQPLQPKQPYCLFCSGDHYSGECPRYKTSESRMDRANERKRCTRCVGYRNFGHRCDVQYLRKCFYCDSKEHAKIFCPQQYPNFTKQGKGITKTKTIVAVEKSDESDCDEKGGTPSAVTVLNETGDGALFQMARTSVKNPHTGKEINTRLVMDSLSSRNYITEKAAKQLGLKPKNRQKLYINVFASEKTVTVPTDVVELDIALKDGTERRIRLNTTPMICNSNFLPSNWPKGQRKYLKSMKHMLADDPFDQDSRVDILIGAALMWEFILGSKMPTDVPGLSLLPSSFGLLLAGSTEGNDDEPVLLCLTESCVTYPSEIGLVAQESSYGCNYPDVDEFWKLDTIGIKDDPIITDDDQALEMTKRTIQHVDGRYELCWPWIEERKPLLPSNYKVAFSRFCHLAKRLSQEDESSLLASYQKVIETQTDAGIIEVVPEDEVETANPVHYLPHHPVVKQTSVTTKVRIVYDASAKASKNDFCLNDCLFRGPVILPDLCQCLLRIRSSEVAIVCDVEKAFLQLVLQKHDRDVTRFFWFNDPSNPSVQDNVAIYRFRRVMFGVISSPFLLGVTLKHHLEQEGTELANRLMNNIYVDNVTLLVDHKEESTKYYSELKDLFARAGMNITEFCSNSTDFMHFVPENDKVKNQDVRLLGMKWDSANDDTLRIIQSPKWASTAIITKRQILHAVASVFDPLGLFQPVMLPAKVLMQDLWIQKLNWDDPVNSQLQQRWHELRKSMEELFNMRLPRFVGNVKSGASLAIFSDASSRAYCTTVYLRSRTNDGDVRCHLILCKSRLAPCSNDGTRTKTVTMPRLELLGATIAAKAAEFCREAFGQPEMMVDFFIDSKCVLHWLKSKSLLKRFVSRRVEEISKVKNAEFHYVTSDDNPSDYGTRGKTAEELATSNLWWNGPSWLIHDRDKWPKCDIPPIPDDEVANFRKETNVPVHQFTLAAPEVHVIHDPLGIDISRFSSYDRLIRVTVICLKFLKTHVMDELRRDVNIGIFEQISDGDITVDEFQLAERLWIETLQNQQYADVKKCITQRKQHPLIKQLGLVLDDDGLIRCVGRHANAQMPEAAKHPLLLPKRHRFTELLVQRIHERAMHVGVSHTLSLTRQQYWIPQGRMLVKTILGRCVICRHYRAGRAYRIPPMPPWPPDRVQPSTAFQHVGLDYFGPVNVRIGENVRKMWACLFTCLATRAVHLEAVTDCSAKEFLNCLIRFVSRRGAPDSIISDNAAQFRVTKMVGDNTWRDIRKDEHLLSYSVREGIRWKFIVELAPWQGGFYERLVGVVKSTLRASIRRKLLTWSDFITLLAESEAIVNSRPLTYVTNDVNSAFRVIRPCDFLTQFRPHSLTNSAGGLRLATAQLGDAGRQLARIWNQRLRTLDYLWSVWQEDYLTSLREQSRMNHRSMGSGVPRVPQVEEVVIVKDDDMPRGSWKIGRISAVFPSTDGQIRSAEVQLANGVKLRRSVAHLIPLEVNGSFVDNDAMRSHDDDNNTDFYGFSQTDVDRFEDGLNRFLQG